VYSDDDEYDDGNESDDTAKAIEQGREEAEAQPRPSTPGKEETTEEEAVKTAAEDGKGEFDEVAL
jgi:hypothetical protein